MGCYLHSYYDSGTDKWYLSDIIQENNQLHIKCVLCKRITQTDTLDSNWKNNSLVKTHITKMFSLADCRAWKWLNSPCEHCVYLRKVDINVYKMAKAEKTVNMAGDEKYVYCNLRNELFIDHCHELFVDCKFNSYKSLVCVNYIIDMELKRRYLNTINQFAKFDYGGGLELKKKYKFFCSKYYALTPFEFSTILKLSSQSVVMGSSIDFILYQQADQLCIDNAWYTTNPIALIDYYNLALRSLCNIIAIENLSVCLIWYQKGYYMVGDEEIINKYDSLLKEATK